ncbi:MAG: DUF695 domain-containing protein [bacterium]|nr:DUF695 domain-containing protein [bacterium]
MGFLNIFKKKEQQISTYNEFWSWFQSEEKAFYKVIEQGGNFERDFFDKLSPKLDQLRDGYYYLAGMFDEKTAELIITADGSPKNIPFVEDLIESAPNIENWRFTALKPESDIEDVAIKMDGHEFNADNMSFYAVTHEQYPDEIDIVITHKDFTEENHSILVKGTYIFLDNYLGELNFAVSIDTLTVSSPSDAQQELIPIQKLKEYLIWREKEFIEKYEATYYNSGNDIYSSLKAKMNSGNPMFAVVNSSLLEWNAKPSHPWIVDIDFVYVGSNGMPDKLTYKKLDEFEDELMNVISDSDGFLNIGRQTADNHRNIYFACKEFRKTSRAIEEMLTKFDSSLNGSYHIYKDKYWQSFNRFIPALN